MTDDPALINRQDGFSRLTPLVTGFATALDETRLPGGTDGPMVLLATQPGARFAARVPLRFEVYYNHSGSNPESLLIAYPAAPLAPATEYTAVVLDSVRTVSGTPIARAHDAAVSLGLAPAVSADEAAMFGYHAPARMALTAAGIDPAHVVRLWDFTTRSQQEPTAWLTAMRAAGRAAVDAGQVHVAIDALPSSSVASVAVVVEGRLTGLPSFLDGNGQIAVDSAGAPVATGVHDAVFRVVVPVGTGSYRVVMYGHGTGGNFHDDSFDGPITAAGAAKVGLRFVGWTDTDVINTFGTLTQMIVGTGHSTAGLVQSLADGMAIQRAMGSILGDALAAPMLGTTPNPAAGRRPDVTLPVWAGGSLGGTLGLVYASAEPEITAAVLNVPGTGWTHFTPGSSMFAGVRALLRSDYPNDVDLRLGLAMTQGAWDPVDGANYVGADAAHAPLMLVQESMGDPVLPNIGSELVAASVQAVQLGAVLAPVEGATHTDDPVSQNALTQYRVPQTVTAYLDIHGFAARDTPAGVAARAQITAFISSVWRGAGQIALPDACVTNTPARSCDFANAH
jgi:hypothetical protein